MSILRVKPIARLTHTMNLASGGHRPPLQFVVMATLSSPLAFEFCEGGTCADAKPSGDNKHVSCPPSDTCSKGGCYCQLFKRPKGSADTVAWEVAHADHKKQTKYRPDKLEYKCLCVKPILEGELTVDGVKYSVRYQVCGVGSCSLDLVDVDTPQGTRHEMKCSGKCDGECKCTLFRLQVAPKAPAAFDPKDAKWELVAKADKQVLHEDNYIYHCFCVK
jgi:hypothetical protein